MVFEVIEEVDIEEAPPSVAADIAKQIPVSAARGMGIYGELADVVGQQQEALAPGQRQRVEAEAKAGPILSLFLDSDDDILPASTRLAAKKDVDQFFNMLGIDPEAQTPAGRIIGRGVELASEGGALGGGAGFAGLSGLAGLLGQGIREFGGPEGLATGTELGLPLTSVGISTIKGLRNLLSPPAGIQKTSKGITKLKGSGRALEPGKAVNRTAFQEATSRMRKEAFEAVDKIAAEELPFSKYLNEETSKAFNRAFDLQEEVAASLPNKTALPPKTTEAIRNRITDLQQIKDPGKATLRELRILRKAERNLTKEPLSATEWNKQYRSYNKEIRDAMRSSTEGGQSELGAYQFLRSELSEAIPEMFAGTDFGKGYQALNSAYSQMKKAETLSSLVNSAFKGKTFNPTKLSDILSSKGSKLKQLQEQLGKPLYNEIKTLGDELKATGEFIKDLSPKANMTFMKQFRKELKEDAQLGILGWVFPSLKPALKVVEVGKGVGAFGSLAKRKLANRMLDPQFRRTLETTSQALKDMNWKDIRAGAKKIVSELEKPQEEEIEEEAVGFEITD